VHQVCFIYKKNLRLYDNGGGNKNNNTNINNKTRRKCCKIKQTFDA